jgi:hypothetical protein
MPGELPACGVLVLIMDQAIVFRRHRAIARVCQLALARRLLLMLLALTPRLMLRLLALVRRLVLVILAGAARNVVGIYAAQSPAT